MSSTDHINQTELHDLILKAKERDQIAFGTLYDLFAAKIYRFISYKLPTREQAEDILQETFLKAWQALPKLTTEKIYFNAWLYTIARNLINDHYRILKRRPTPETIENHYDLASNDDPQTQAADTISRQQLHKALHDLPSLYRQVLELRFLQELSVEETAKILKKTVISVRVMQHRAIRKINQTFPKQD